MKLSIIIVAYNSENFIEKCVKSLLKNLPSSSEVIIIDNNSSDGTVKRLKNFLPKILLIESDRNLGFGKANNLAAKKAKGEYLFFLNPDTEVLQPIFDELVEFYEGEKDAGIVSPKLVQMDGRVQESVKRLPTILGAVREYILGIPHAYSQYAPQTNKPLEVESVYGAAMLIKKDLFQEVNGFDEKFFLYYEDVDLCKRIKTLGKKIYYYPNVLIKHMVGATKSEQNRYRLNKDSFNKYHGFFEAFILQVIFLIPRLRRRLTN